MRKSNFDKQSVFVVGSARSGTTFIQNIINSSDEAFLLGESNFHWRWNYNNFVFQYNLQHSSNGAPPSRKSFLSEEWIGLTAREVVEKLSHQFRITGSKIALPLFEEHPENSTIDKVFNFQTANFFCAKYFHTFRDPVSVALSAQILFKNSTSNDILAGWLESIIFQIISYDTFPYSYYIPQENLNIQTIKNIESILNTALQADESWINLPSSLLSQSREGQDQLDSFTSNLIMAPGQSESASKIIDRASDLYRRIVSIINPETMRIKTTVSPYIIIENELLPELRHLLNSINNRGAFIKNYMDPINLTTAKQWTKIGIVLINAAELKVAEQGVIITPLPGEGQKALIKGVIIPKLGPSLYSIDVKTGTSKNCVLQIGQSPGLCQVSFDLVNLSVTSVASVAPSEVLFTSCQALDNEWIRCQIGFVNINSERETYFGFYLANPDGSIECSAQFSETIIIYNIVVRSLEYSLSANGYRI